MGRFTTTTSNQEDFKTTSVKYRGLLLCAVLKLSDVGHTAKGKVNHMKWTDKIMEEFFCQGEKEKDMGMAVSAFMDREKMKNQKGICQVRSNLNLMPAIFVVLAIDHVSHLLPPCPFSQEGFLNFIVLPLYKAWVGIFKESKPLLTHLERNYQYWSDLAVEERKNQQPASPS